MELPFKITGDKQMIVFMGIQASGKSTFYHELLERHGYAHINLDTLHTRRNESLALQDCLCRGKSFVVDNTNPEIADRERYIPLAKAHGYEIIGIFFQSIVRDCVRRNADRDNSVPLQAIPCTSNKLQLPAYDEGFDKLYFTRIVGNGFEITDWRV